MNVILPVVLSLGLGIPLRQITVEFLRDGEPTPTQKVAILLVPDSLAQQAYFVAKNGVSATNLMVASAVDGEWMVLAKDSAPPKRASARYPLITEDTTLVFDLSEGSSSGGKPALLSARVLVEGVVARREVLAVEHQTDGEWRVAGHARTSAAGEADMDLRITGAGRVYAVGMDDWGSLFQPGLAVAVDDTVRPISMQGWLYRITEAGTLPATEPEWWPAEGDNASRLLGTARAIAVRYYQPLAHGPLPVELL